jgi:hypothetical protein
VLRFAEHLKFNSGKPRRTETADTTYVVIDSRTGHKELTRWLGDLEELLPTTIEGPHVICDLESLTRSEITFRLMQTVKTHLERRFEEIEQASHGSSMPSSDLQDFGMTLGHFMETSRLSAVNMIAILGLENDKACTTALKLIWDLSDLFVIDRAESYAVQLLQLPLNERTFYALIKIIDAYQFVLFKQEKWELAETTLIQWLKKLQETPVSVRRLWSFSNDPILDILEFLIVFYRDKRPNANKLPEYVDKYRDYYMRTYGHWPQRLFLGCGAGVFGMSFARVRLEWSTALDGDEDPDSSEADETLLEDEKFFQDIKRLYGPRAQNFIEHATSRRQERDLCHALAIEFLTLFGKQAGRFSFGSLIKNEDNENRTAMDIEDDLAGRSRRSGILKNKDALPSGFEARLSNGRIYYVDHNSKTTSWDPPQLAITVSEDATDQREQISNPPTATSHSSGAEIVSAVTTITTAATAAEPRVETSGNSSPAPPSRRERLRAGFSRLSLSHSRKGKTK